MAYDEDLADRIRELVSGQANLTEKKMFGGLAFLIGGHMAISASGRGGVLVRVDPRDTDKLVSSSNAQIAIMQRTANGRVAPGRSRTRTHEVSAGQMGTIGTAYARSLPPK